MKAGQTELEVGTRVKLQNIKGEDKELNQIAFFYLSTSKEIKVC